MAIHISFFLKWQLLFSHRTWLERSFDFCTDKKLGGRQIVKGQKIKGQKVAEKRGWFFWGFGVL